MNTQGNDLPNGATLPLAGLRVAECTGGTSAWAGRYLAELGADVIKIVAKAGTGLKEASDFGIADLGKHRFVGSPDDHRDRARLEALLGTVDLLIISRDGAPVALDIAAARMNNPQLVVLAISDFGKGNRFSGWRGGDAVLQALGGQLSRSGIPGEPPLLAPGGIALQSAIVQAVFVALIAYVNRLKTGRGDLLDFALVEGAAQALDPGFGIQGSATSGVPASKLPRGRPEARFQYPIIACADGFVRICVLAKRQWRSLFDWMGQPEEFADPSFDRIATRYKSKTLIPAIARFFGGYTREELETEGERRGIPIAPLLTLSEALDNEQFTARGALRTVKLPNGLEAKIPNGMMDLDGTRVSAPQEAVDGQKDEGRQGDDVRRALAWTDSESERPLSGLRVLDLGVIVVGAEQSRLLADQGADVIKVENPDFPDGTRQTRDGGPMSPAFAAGHRNKRSLALNLRHPRGKDILLRLVAISDVLMSNFKPGTLASLGLDEATLRTVNPALVIADSSAFGPTGPWSGRMGYGPLVRAAAGLTEMWSYPDQPGSYSDALTVYPDHVAGRISAIGALALLIRRARTGSGGRISVSQAEVMLTHLSREIALLTASDTLAAGERFANLYACEGDDEWCVVELRSDAEKAALLTTIGRTSTASDEEIHDTLVEWMATRSPMVAAEQLQTAGVPAAPMLRVQDMSQFPYFAERNFLRPLRHPSLDEDYLTENAPVRSERLVDPPDRPAPIMGEHSREIMAELLDLTPNEIDALIEEGVLFEAQDREKA
ncbi:MAG: CoA transferase [Parasphingopyxis sp.]|uniref:CaiB/BaiF CoA-transferase family protein n=1 Tax=Parasphingopyxis sp. TaxID=1920299 RepID=UPI0032EBB51E